MESKLDIPLHGYSVNIVKRCRHALSDILSCKFGCVATIEGVDFERDRSIASPTVAPEKRFDSILPMGVQVSVWKADLTTFKADAVVNAANSRLQHWGGLAQALSEAGGPQIQRECDDYIKKHGDLKTGEAIVSGAGALQCNKIIHAVGPDLPRNPSGSAVSRATPLLEMAIVSILDRVKENRLTTVAIPAISSGLFHYPLSECADTIVSTVKRYYEKSSSKGHCLKQIFFVNNDDPTVKEMERACHQIFANQKPMTSSHATRSTSRGSANTSPPPVQKPKAYDQKPMTYSQATRSTSRGSANTSPPTVQIGNVLLILKRDKLEEQRTDVIVNTAAAHKDLSYGQISRVLLQKAGSGMQKEIRNASMNGRVIPTGSYKLPCIEVYHTFCIDKTLPTASQVLYDSVFECLQRAAASQHKSIAFPAIGTGNLGFTKAESATIMLHAVTAFASSCQRMMEVHFVIFPFDHETFKAFDEEIRSLQQHQSSAAHHSPTSELPRDDFHRSRAPSPQISLTGLSEESTREAEKWLTDLLNKSSGPVTIYNNFIQHFSEKQYRQLTRLIEKGVSIEEFLSKGHACITIDGDSHEDVVITALQVEAMLCTIQKEFVSEEEFELQTLTTDKVSFPKRTPVDHGQEFKDRASAFKYDGLRVIKVDKVENSTLETLFHLKKNQLARSTSKTMFQRIPAQFCELVCSVGFHAECAPPEDPAYGDGIYFTGSVKTAMKTWKEKNEEYLYFVEAEVLTGDSTSGKPGLILPPAKGKGPNGLYDSVTGGSDVAVIFSGYQALPRYIITCKRS